MRPVIGIMPRVENNADSTVQPLYVQAIAEAGGLPIMLPYTLDTDIIEQFVGMCDGFLFAGGADIEPERYGEERQEALGATTPLRDRVELLAFEKIFNTGRPILGICRGCQLVNVALGGSLYQDIPTDIGTAVTHRVSDGQDALRHSVSITPSTPLYSMLGARAEINSLHHQSIKRLGQGLCVSAVADDGVIEAAYLPGHPFLQLLQWHPERMIETEGSRRVFKEFIRASSKS